MSTTVVVPARDYIIPVFKDRDRTYTTTYATGLLLISATEYLLINATDKLIVLDPPGVSVQAPVIVVPFRDYTIPVPERLTNG